MKTIDHVREGTVARYTEANGFKLAICVGFGRDYQLRVRLYRATAGKWTNPELVDRAHLAPLGKIEVDGPSRQHKVLTKALEALWTTSKLGLGPAHMALLVVTAAQVQQAVRRAALDRGVEVVEISEQHPRAPTTKVTCPCEIDVRQDSAGARRLLRNKLILNAHAREHCPARDNAHHASITCDGSCCTTCGGPIDDNEECRC